MSLLDSVTIRTNHSAQRKVSKPLMERRRRARINACLGELRTLLLQARVPQGCHRSKLEKADILELTVRHLRFLCQRTKDSAHRSQFCAGYLDCAQEVNRFFSTTGRTHSAMRASLVQGLANKAPILTNDGAINHSFYLRRGAGCCHSPRHSGNDALAPRHGPLQVSQPQMSEQYSPPASLDSTTVPCQPLTLRCQQVVPFTCQEPHVLQRKGVSVLPGTYVRTAVWRPW